MEDISIRRMMETSDLPKLSKRFDGETSFATIAWKVYLGRLRWVSEKFNWKWLRNEFDESNPLVTLFTWSVMVPVGGTFCGKE